MASSVRLLIRSVIQDDLSSDDLKTFCWCLDSFPKNIRDKLDAIDILDYLEQNNIISCWENDNFSLFEHILVNEIHRVDLEDKITQLRQHKGKILAFALYLNYVKYVHVHVQPQKAKGFLQPIKNHACPNQRLSLILPQVSLFQRR